MNETIELNEDSAMEYLAESKGMTEEEFRESLTPRERSMLLRWRNLRVH
jgi:hypothetical protein